MPLESAAELTVEPVEAVAHVAPRLLGWLKLLHHKSLLQDDWSRFGAPDRRWDRYSTVPLMSWRRFDLVDSAYAIALLAELTPAWRELYVDILDRLIPLLAIDALGAAAGADQAVADAVGRAS
jgi:hypothetical protein